MSDLAGYRLLLLSPIPVAKKDGKFLTIDLWKRDLAAQVQVADVILVCPSGSAEFEATANAPLDAEILVYFYDELSTDQLVALVHAADVVQLPGNAGWRNSNPARRIQRMARHAGKTILLGVSSNRAKSAVLNAWQRGYLRVAKAAFDYLDIRSSQSWLAYRSDGVFVVGDGVARLFRYTNRNLHVGIASWIETADILPPRSDAPTGPLRICMASRLERMKGVHVGIAAVQKLVARKATDVRLTIIGQGAEKPRLQEQVQRANLSGITRFCEPVAYPQPFFNLLDANDVVLLTNLSDEQPRLIFDAISRGCVPICPDTAPYRGLGLSDTLYYRSGDADDLSRTIERFIDVEVRNKVRMELVSSARRFTINHMHEERASWVETLRKVH